MFFDFFVRSHHIFSGRCRFHWHLLFAAHYGVSLCFEEKFETERGGVVPGDNETGENVDLGV